MNRQAHPRRNRTPAARRAPRPGSLPLAVVTAALVASGCRPAQTQFQVVSFLDPERPVRLAESHLPPGYFSNQPGKNWAIAFQTPPVPVHPEGGPQADPSTIRDSTGEATSQAASETLWMSQTIYIEVFWRPLPGRTFAERSQTNAHILYCLTTGRDPEHGETAVGYRGAGFVYFDLSRDGRSIEGTIESSSLRPIEGERPEKDILGPCRLTGAFTAVEDKRKVAEILQWLRHQLGPMTPTASR